MIPRTQSYLVVGPNPRPQTNKIIKKYGLAPNPNPLDTQIITPPKREILIDQIRHLKSRIYQKPFAGPRRLVIIEQAEKLNRQAQNALLKILEEPPGHALIILEAANKHPLLPTVLSRVTIIYAGQKPDISTDLDILRHDPLSLLENLSQVGDPTAWLDSQMLLLCDLLKETLTKGQRTADREKIISAISKCRQAKQMIAASVNPKFVLADLVFSLQSG